MKKDNWQNRIRNHYEKPIILIPGKTYIRKSLHEAYGGQSQYGISTPRRYNSIFIFAMPGGKKHGYHDGWNQNKTLYSYTGEGQIGDMVFLKGNKAILNHIEDKKDLYLFEDEGGGRVRFIGQMVYQNYSIKDADSKGQKRKTIIFQLVPIETIAYTISEEDELLSKSEPGETLSLLRTEAFLAAKTKMSTRNRTAIMKNRNQKIKKYVLNRPNGKCEACNKEAPFLRRNGIPYLEAHHIHQVKDMIFEDPLLVAAVCPNCHKRAHYGKDAKEFNDGFVAKLI